MTDVLPFFGGGGGLCRGGCAHEMVYTIYCCVMSVIALMYSSAVDWAQSTN